MPARLSDYCCETSSSDCSERARKTAMQPLVPAKDVLVGSVVAGTPPVQESGLLLAHPIGTKTLWAFSSAATECAVVDVDADGSSLLVSASMEPSIGSSLPCRQVVASREEVVPGSLVEPHLVTAADRNSGDDSTVECGARAGDVDDDGLGQNIRSPCRMTRCNRAAPGDAVRVSRPAGVAVLHQEGIGDLHRSPDRSRKPRPPSVSRVVADLRDRDVEQAGLRRPLRLFDPVLGVDPGMHAL